MSFDKIKAMRSAERFLSQGKIRAAIGEYEKIVENDPKDFSTLNILGDLHVKNLDKQPAVECFTQVAEHYNAQGFAHKAIAIYNKISRIEPNSMEIAAKLAQLYQAKGSISEARSHYTALAENYQRRGMKIEALAIWKQIAELDANNTEIYLKIAESCRQEEQYDEAAKAFIEAGSRFLEQERFEQSLAAFAKALEIKKNNLRALKGSVKAQMSLGYADEAAKILEEVYAEQPHNREILHLLADCYLEMNNPAEAERAVVKLVEQEPANYPKFLDLIKNYLKNGDLDAAARILSMSSEHLLVGGQADEFLTWTNEILTRNPEQMDALRLLVRFHGWQRDESALKQSLERLAEAARLNELPEAERDALAQLVMLAPQEAEYAQRLHEVNTTHGFADEIPAQIEDAPDDEVETFENFAIVEDSDEQNLNVKEFAFADEFNHYEIAPNGHNGSGTPEYDFAEDNFAPVVVEQHSFDELAAAPKHLTAADEYRLQKEIEGIEFYIAQGYTDLALKSLDEIENEFGNRAELENLRNQIKGVEPVIEPEKSNAGAEIIEEKFESFDDLKNEFGFEENDSAVSSDYETHYHLATAYKEMGLMEDAIREFQDAIGAVGKDDGTRRFFKCSNLLGHCFMEKQMPNLALMWYKRCLEVKNLDDEEKQALYYEIGDAYEAGGDQEAAVSYFEKLYAENVDFRDVGKRLEKLNENNLQIS